MTENHLDTSAANDQHNETSTHAGALAALQAEYQYHLAVENNATYLQKLFGWLPLDTNKTLHNLEALIDTETRNPEILSREQVVNAVTRDQSSLFWRDTVINSIGDATKFGVSLIGKRFGPVTSFALFALDSMHPKDSLEEQAVEGLSGGALGLAAIKLGQYSHVFSDPFTRAMVATVPYTLAGAYGRQGGPDQYLFRPDPEAIIESTPEKAVEHPVGESSDSAIPMFPEVPPRPDLTPFLGPPEPAPAYTDPWQPSGGGPLQICR